MTIVSPKSNREVSLQACRRTTFGAHDLVGAYGITEREAPDVHQTGEWEEQEDRHAEQQVQSEDHLGARHQLGLRREQHDALGPVCQCHHRVGIAVRSVAGRDYGGGEAEDQGDHQPGEDEGIRGASCCAHPWIGYAADPQHTATNQAEQTEKAAAVHGDVLFAEHRQFDRLPQRIGGQQADQMAEEDTDDADVEEVARQHHPLAGEELGRVGLPGVLLAVEADPAADEKDRQRDVGKDAEEKIIQSVHGCLLGPSSDGRSLVD